jgi:hypothetical protein
VGSVEKYSLRPLGRSASGHRRQEASAIHVHWTHRQPSRRYDQTKKASIIIVGKVKKKMRSAKTITMILRNDFGSTLRNAFRSIPPRGEPGFDPGGRSGKRPVPPHGPQTENQFPFGLVIHFPFVPLQKLHVAIIRLRHLLK